MPDDEWGDEWDVARREGLCIPCIIVISAILWVVVGFALYGFIHLIGVAK